MLGDLAIVLQRFIARGFLARQTKRQIADLESSGVVKKPCSPDSGTGSCRGSLCPLQDAHAGALGFDGAGKSSGAGADA